MELLSTRADIAEEQWLTVRGARKAYAMRPAPVVALRGVDLAVSRGRVTAR